MLHFLQGEYSGASELQDDYIDMAAHMPYVADDHGNTIAAATALASGERRRCWAVLRPPGDTRACALRVMPACPGRRGQRLRPDALLSRQHPQRCCWRAGCCAASAQCTDWRPSFATGATASGIIGYNDTADVFKVDAGAGSLSVQVGAAAGSSCTACARTPRVAAGSIRRPMPPRRLELSSRRAPLQQVNIIPAWSGNSRANLDVKLQLLDAAGAVLATVNPAGTGSPLTQLAASLSTTLAAPGAYYLSVSKTGYADPLSTGYSDYGSVGAATWQRGWWHGWQNGTVPVPCLSRARCCTAP